MKKVREFVLYNLQTRVQETRNFTKYHAAQAGEFIPDAPHDMPVSLESALNLMTQWNKQIALNRQFVYWIEPTAIFEE